MSTNGTDPATKLEDLIEKRAELWAELEPALAPESPATNTHRRLVPPRPAQPTPPKRLSTTDRFHTLMALVVSRYRA